MGEYVNNGLLRVARLRSGFPQGEAAQRLGIPQVSLSRYENAVSVPNDEFIARAAAVYDLPVSFFHQTDPVYGAPVSVHPMWRKKSDVTVRELDRIIGEINIRIMHLRRLLQAVEYTPQANIPRLDLDDYQGDIEQIAAIVRAHWLLPSGPVESLTGTMERAGVVISYSTLGASTVSGVTISAPGLPPIVVLNIEQPADRLRFTLAHELGHLVMHRLFPGPNMESEANDFASAFLMPRKDITPVLSGKLDLRRLAALKPEWRVSMQALLYRAQSLGLVGKQQAGWLWRQFNTSRIKFREPPQLDFAPERPGVITRMVRLHLDTFGYSMAELAKLLHIHEKQLPQFYDLTSSEPVPGLRLRVVR
jgi:Zn-dependent peptidase ImmA (M78 family)